MACFGLCGWVYGGVPGFGVGQLGQLWSSVWRFAVGEMSFSVGLVGIDSGWDLFDVT